MYQCPRSVIQMAAPSIWTGNDVTSRTVRMRLICFVTLTQEWIYHKNMLLNIME